MDETKTLFSELFDKFKEGSLTVDEANDPWLTLVERESLLEALATQIILL